MSNVKEPYPSLGGYITSPKDFIGKNNKKIDPYGIFSEQCFGPEKNYSCSCGNYNIRILHENKICPNCGVLCGSNELRFSTFGKIKLAFPIIKPTKKDKILKIIGDKHRIIINPIRVEATKDKSYYIAIKYDRSKIELVDKLNSKKKFLTIPFRITGIYSLYLVFKFIAINFKIQEIIDLFDDKCFTYDMKVLPPNLRMVLYDDIKKEVRSPDVNKHYVSILNQNRSNELITKNLEFDENDWLSKIETSLKAGLLDQDIVEPIVLEYDSKTAIYQYYVNKIFDVVYEQLSGKVGLIRNSILGKNIEFSARTVIRISPDLPPYQIKVSKTILKKLWMPYFLHYLINIKGLEPVNCYQDLLLYETLNSNMSNYLFDEFLEWFYSEEENIN